MNDMETLQDIWTELGTRLRAFVGSRVNDSHAADDIVQDMLLKVPNLMHCPRETSCLHGSLNGSVVT